jgi:PAS domain S-box-containing protein
MEKEVKQGAILNDTPAPGRVYLTVEGIKVLFLDMDENKQVEQGLQERGALFQKALQHSPVVVFSQDRDLRYTWVLNPHLGFCSQKILGKTDVDLLPADEAGRLVEIKARVMEAGKAERHEVRTTIHGKPFYYDLKVEPLIDSSGEIVGVIGVSTDITRMKMAAVELTKLNKKLETQVVEHFKELDELQYHLMESTEKERAFLSRELHDGPIQELYALLYWLKPKHPDGISTVVFEKIRNELTRVIRNLRNISSDLRPPILDAFGLAKAIADHASSYKKINPDLVMELDLIPDAQQIPKPTRMALYRIFQVTLNNVVRHASASRVEIRLDLDAEFAYLEIKDDGVGFEVPKRWIDFARKGHLGLVGAKERAEAVKGKMEVQSKPGKGTLIRVVVPVE